MVAMPLFSKARLEGRALEHALAGDGGKRIRMKDPKSGSFEWIGGAEAAEIRRYMDTRLGGLREEMQKEGLHIQRADCPVTIGREARSVDLCLWSSPHGGNALVEVKWTRRQMGVAMAWGSASLPMLKRACKEGVWMRGGKGVKASVVGVLVVRPQDWCCKLSPASGSTSVQFPSDEGQRTPRRRSRGKSQSGAQKRKCNNDMKANEKEWRRTAGKAMTRRHEAEYRARSKKAKRRRAKADRYRRQRCC